MDFADVLRTEMKKSPPKEKMAKKYPTKELLFQEIKDSCLLSAQRGQHSIVLKNAIADEWALDFMVYSSLYEQVMRMLRSDGLIIRKMAPSIAGMHYTIIMWADPLALAEAAPPAAAAAAAVPEKVSCEEESQRKIVADDKGVI